MQLYKDCRHADNNDQQVGNAEIDKEEICRIAKFFGATNNKWNQYIARDS